MSLVVSVAPKAVAEVHEPAPLQLEVAPADLALVTATDVLIAAPESGRELYLFSPEKALVQRYTENGRAWGDPIDIRRDLLRQPMAFFRMDVGDGRIVLSGHSGVGVFAADDGTLLSQHRIFQPGDIAALPTGSLAMSLINVPHPAKEGFYLGRDGKEAPRLAIYDADGEEVASGLFEETSQRTASSAMARALRLTWGERRLYAAEVGSYRILAFDREFEERAQYHDPELDFVESGASETEESSDAVSTDEEASLSPPGAPGQDLASTASRRRPVASLAVDLAPVVVDIAWGSKPGQLYILLDPSAFRGSWKIDVLDPLSNEIRRTAVTLPPGAEGVLTQIAVGRRFLWLRGYAEGSPILRIDRALLDQGTAMTAPLVIPGDITGNITAGEVVSPPSQSTP